MRVIITGGGTGGHISPGLAIAEALRERSPAAEILFVGGGGMESRIIPSAGWSFVQLPARPLPRRPTIRGLWALTVLGVGGLQAMLLLSRTRPDVVVATGGYAAAPVGAAAALLRIPLILQEQNLRPGATNRFLGRWARAVSVSSEVAKVAFPGKAVATGVPIRKSALGAVRGAALSRLGLFADRRTLLVLGGSQGALSLNTAVIEMLSLRSARTPIQVLHQTGLANLSSVREEFNHLEQSRRAAVHYVVVPYLDPIGDAYAVADLVVSRAGAATLAEITANGRPAILVPYPHAAGGHQVSNAKVLEMAGAAIAIEDHALSGARLAALVGQLFDSPARLSSMAAASLALGRPQAAQAVGDLILQAATPLHQEVARDRSQ